MRYVLRLRVVLATIAAAATVLLPAHPATALTAADSTCQITGSMHLSSGLHIDYPLHAAAGNYYMISTVAVCEGTQAGLGFWQSAGNYADPGFVGAFNLNITTGLGGNCNGGLNATRAGTLMAGTLNSVMCTGSATPGRGALSFTLQPNPLTINTCGGSATDPVVCDFFFHGSITYENTV